MIPNIKNRPWPSMAPGHSHMIPRLSTIFLGCKPPWRLPAGEPWHGLMEKFAENHHVEEPNQ